MSQSIWFSVLFLVSLTILVNARNGALPLVINTWPFTDATKTAWRTIRFDGGSAVDAVERGCSQCEIDQCDGTVGWGGSPDENGETTLDAMIINADTHDMGGVGALRRVKQAISVARKVMDNTNHTLLVGDQATQFAISLGFQETSLSSDSSIQIHSDWKNASCQPNYWSNVQPDPKSQCGPYHVSQSERQIKVSVRNGIDASSEVNHDTIGMLVIDSNGSISAGTSTNGLSHKIPGRVGDSPIPGAGAYAEKGVGAAAGTGDGDVAMRFAPAYQAVANLRLGMSPTAAAKDAVDRMAKFFPESMMALIVADTHGDFGAACNGIETFPFSVMNPTLPEVTVYRVNCTNPIKPSPHQERID